MASPVYTQITVNLGAAVSAGTDEVWEIPFALPGTWKITKAYLQNSGAVTAHDTNYADYSLELGGTEVASEQTTTGDLGNITAGDRDELALTGTGTSLEIAQGGQIRFKKTDAGTGAALGAASGLSLAFEQVRA